MNTSWLRLASAAVASGSLGVVFGTSLRPVTAEEKVSPPPVKLVERATRDPKWKSFRQATVHSGIKEWEYNWDCRHFDAVPEDEALPSGDVKRRPTATRHLILVRHGQYNLAGKDDSERTLTPMGIVQAGHTGKRLAELNLPLTYIISSTMSRAKQTAALIAQHLPPGLTVLPDDPILKEGAPYPPEPGTCKVEVPYHVDGARIEAAFRKYFHRADREQEEDSFELVVCHANVIRYFVCRALQLPPEAWLRISLKHASITWVTIRPDGRCSIRAMGEASHIPPENLSTTRDILPY